jgi:hypothetical protein
MGITLFEFKDIKNPLLYFFFKILIILFDSPIMFFLKLYQLFFHLFKNHFIIIINYHFFLLYF